MSTSILAIPERRVHWLARTADFVELTKPRIAALVLVTVVGIGFLIYWLVPGIPLLPALALAAVLSPTDAVALSGIVGEGRIPKKIMGILQGEALMNDAEFIIAQLDVDPTKRQVPVEFTKKNPFYLFIEKAVAVAEPLKPTEDVEAKRKAELMKKLEGELARFKLQSILPNGRKPVAIIDNKIVQIGDAQWRARTNRATPIKAGEPMRVAAIDGVTLEVEPLEGAAKDYRDRRSKTKTPE